MKSNPVAGTAHSAPWWHTFFDGAFADLWMARRDGAPDVAFLLEELGLRPGARVFDQCCGVGRLSAGLAAASCDVVGVDRAPRYIERARAAAPAAAFHVDDALSFRATPACDAAFNWWTSFGYSAHDTDNVRMLEAAFDSLLAGGRFALDYPNVTQLRAAFRPRSEDVFETATGTTRVVREAHLDEARGMLVDVWTYEKSDGEVHSRGGETRLYDVADLDALLDSVGFRVVRRFGGVDRSPLSAASRRCIIVAERPG